MEVGSENQVLPPSVPTTTSTSTLDSSTQNCSVRTSRPCGGGLMVTRKHPAAICEECDLYGIGRFVPSDGPERTNLAVVGEAPGANEARLGHPFVGVSG